MHDQRQPLRKTIRRVIVAVAACVAMPAGVAETYLLPLDNQNVIGSVTTVRSIAEDTLVDIARRHGLGYTDLVKANPDVDPWLPGEGTEITLPTQFVLPDVPRRGVVLNLAEYRLYYFPRARSGEPTFVHTYPISIGRQNWETPLGLTKVVAKAVRPSWYPPRSVHEERAENGDPPLPNVVPPGPDNPLGERAMRLGLPGYLIHGTNRPAGVGMRVTHGCIRMFPEDIEVLFEQIPVGLPVRIVNQPIKFGWLNGVFFMEAHEPLASAPPADEPGVASAMTSAQGAIEVIADVVDDEDHQRNVLTALTRAYVAATGEQRANADWALMESVLLDAQGIPMPVGTVFQTPEAQSAAAR